MHPKGEPLWDGLFHRRFFVLSGIAAAILAVFLFAACGDNNEEEAAVPEQQAAGETPMAEVMDETGVSGTISIEGSSTVQPFTIQMIPAFEAAYPDVHVNPPSGLGSGAGITAFINKEVDIAQASRHIKDDEIAQAQAEGLDPYETTIFNDALAIVVHPSNPITHMTFEQVAKVFAGEITDFSEFGGEGGITVYTRNEESGTFAYMEEDVIQKALGADAGYSPDINKQANAPAGLAAVSNDPSGIFYAGLGNLAEVPEGSVKVLLIAADDASEPVEPSAATVASGEYPISRGLFYYTDGDPATSPNPAVTAFIDFALSPEGQSIGEEIGFLPVGPTQ
jgi:phosphate transport system substrate-binding protein